MTKETVAALILMIITYLFIVFVTLDFNPISWHWSRSRCNDCSLVLRCYIFRKE
jgi:hypothetical protein